MPTSKPTATDQHNDQCDDHRDALGDAAPTVEILPAVAPPETPEYKDYEDQGNGGGLSLRREAFCRAYVLDPNATRAASAAGYAAPSARSQGSRLLTNVDIQTRIRDLRVELARRHAVDADVLMGKLEAVYLRAFEHYQMHTCVRAVALQAQLAGTLGDRPSGSGGPSISRRREPAAPVAVHDTGPGADHGAGHSAAHGQAAARVGS